MSQAENLEKFEKTIRSVGASGLELAAQVLLQEIARREKEGRPMTVEEVNAMQREISSLNLEGMDVRGVPFLRAAEAFNVLKTDRNGKVRITE